MKKVLLLLMSLMLVLLVGCGGEKETSGEVASEESAEPFKVGILLSTGGLGDKSFNDSAYRGLQKAEADLGIKFKYIDPGTPNENIENMTAFVEGGYDLIIGLGFDTKDTVQTVASENPDSKFVLIDEVIDDLDNVESIIFAEDEGSFLVGALAAMMTESNVIGFVGGAEIPLIQKFENGYAAGAKYVNPEIEVKSIYTSGGNPFNDPVQGKTNTASLINQGVDAVYHAAGGTGTGVISAAEEKGIYAFGVDSNQDHVAKGTVLTSMVKNVDEAVYRSVKAAIAGNYTSGLVRLNLAEGGVGTTNFEFTRETIGEEKIAKLEEIKQGIIDGSIKVSE